MASAEKSSGACTLKCSKRRVNLTRGAGIEEHSIYPESARFFLKRFRRGVSGCRIAGIDQHSEAGRLGQKLMHESEPLDVDFKGKKIDPGRVAAWSREARNEAQHHRVLTHAEHNRDC